MAKRYPVNVRQAGTISGTTVTLGAAVDSYVTLSDHVSAGNIADGDTVDVTLFKDASNVAVYDDVPWASGANTLDLSSGTLDAGGSVGTVGNGDTVVVWVAAGQDALEAFSTGLQVSPPSGPSDTGAVGQWAWSSPYLYFYVASNTWVRLVPARTW
jgi:hypothetical protein